MISDPFILPLLYTSYEGETVNNLPSGDGKAVYKNGASYSGVFSNGLPHGSGVLTLSDGTTYNGSFFQGKPHSHHEITFPDSSVYSGDVLHFLPHGLGSYLSYSGAFFNGLRHGFGSFSCSDFSFSGSFCHDLKQGNGSIAYQSPTTTTLSIKFDGTFSDDVYNGSGKVAFKDGDLLFLSYSGDWERGQKHGKGVVIGYDSSTSPFSFKFVGNWKQDQKSGKGVAIYQIERQSNVGDYDLDCRHGKFVIFCQNSNFSIQNFENGKFVDGCQNLFPNFPIPTSILNFFNVTEQELTTIFSKNYAVLVEFFKICAQFSNIDPNLSLMNQRLSTWVLEILFLNFKFPLFTLNDRIEYDFFKNLDKIFNISINQSFRTSSSVEKSSLFFHDFLKFLLNICLEYAINVKDCPLFDIFDQIIHSLSSIINTVNTENFAEILKTIELINSKDSCTLYLKNLFSFKSIVQFSQILEQKFGLLGSSIVTVDGFTFNLTEIFHLKISKIYELLFPNYGTFELNFTLSSFECLELFYKILNEWNNCKFLNLKLLNNSEILDKIWQSISTNDCFSLSLFVKSDFVLAYAANRARIIQRNIRNFLQKRRTIKQAATQGQKGKKSRH
ncbi:hypothetical protein RCL1_008616 [Eukaryota sp. TZLM3-RCL]